MRSLLHDLTIGYFCETDMFAVIVCSLQTRGYARDTQSVSIISVDVTVSVRVRTFIRAPCSPASRLEAIETIIRTSQAHPEVELRP